MLYFGQYDKKISINVLQKLAHAKNMFVCLKYIAMQ